MKITGVTGRMVLDSRGVPTVEATVKTTKAEATAAAPAGTSTGSHEAKELRDDDKRWGGQGVTKAVSHVNVEIAGALKGVDAADQAAVDAKLRELDQAKKPGLGANAVLAVSVASFLAAARGTGKSPWQFAAGGTTPREIPVPMFNLIEGGAHADNDLDIQESMVVPLGFDTYSEALQAAGEIQQALGTVLKDRNLKTNLGVEDGYAADITTHQEALDLLVQAIDRAGFKAGEQVGLALDVAASELHKNGGYRFGGHAVSAEQMIIEYETLLGQYPIVSLEDPFAEDDWDGWKMASERLKVQLVGDDLTTTDARRVKKAAAAGVNGVIIKPNQVGTLTAAREAAEAARDRGMALIASHRSGETTDSWIADLAVGWQTGLIKAGAPKGGERVAKYNRLLEIEKELGSQAVYPGRRALVNSGGDKNG